MITAIRVATKWYQNHLASKSISVTLLTNDRGNMEKALNEGLKAKTSMLPCERKKTPQCLLRLTPY